MASITPYATRHYLQPYSFALKSPLSTTSVFARSRSALRRILPEGFFGIASRNTTPPVIHLCRVHFPSIHLTTSSAVNDTFGFRTTYARGRSSPAHDSPITAASATAGCSSRMPSSSAGATCRPRTLMSSFF